MGATRRDIVWINHSLHVGGEMPGRHPLLVLSPKAFNHRTSIVIGLPMTHATFNQTNSFAVQLIGPKNEICYVLAHQPKSFDWRTRGARQLGFLAQQIEPFLPEVVRTDADGYKDVQYSSIVPLLAKACNAVAQSIGLDSRACPHFISDS